MALWLGRVSGHQFGTRVFHMAANHAAHERPGAFAKVTFAAGGDTAGGPAVLAVSAMRCARANGSRHWRGCRLARR